MRVLTVSLDMTEPGKGEIRARVEVPDWGIYRTVSMTTGVIRENLDDSALLWEITTALRKALSFQQPILPF